jgi:hypothetical protein
MHRRSIPYRIAILTFAFGLRSAIAADPEVEARERYERALKLYEERAFDAALVELKLAAELRPSYKLLYNIAQVRLAMNDFAAAYESYQQYLEQGGSKIPAARREAVREEMKLLEQRVARLAVETDEPGAEVFVDEVLVGNTPLRNALLVNSGIRQVVVRHPDYVPQSRRLSLGGGTEQTVRFTFASPAPKSGSAVAPPPPSAARTHGSSALPASQATAPNSKPQGAPDSAGSGSFPWLSWGVTGALAAGSLVVGGIALSQNAALKTEREKFGADPDELDSKSSRVSTLATIGDGLAVATLIAGGVSLWLTLDSPAGAQERGATNGLRVGFGANQVTLAGSLD